MSQEERDRSKPRRMPNEKEAIKIALEGMKKAAPEIDRHVRERNALTARARFMPPRAPRVIAKGEDD